MILANNYPQVTSPQFVCSQLSWWDGNKFCT